MQEQRYTLGRWLVRAGEEEAFVAAWRELGVFFLTLNEPPGWGTLLRSIDNPRLFFSFGPWPSMEAIAAMRAHPDTPAAIGRLRALCEESEAGSYLVAATAEAGPSLA